MLKEEYQQSVDTHNRLLLDGDYHSLDSLITLSNLVQHIRTEKSHLDWFDNLREEIQQELEQRKNKDAS